MPVMLNPTEFGFGNINANGSAYIFAPATSVDGNGDLCSIPGRGNFLLTTDLSSVQVQAFDLGPPPATTPFYTDTPAVGTVIFDTIQTTGIWEVLPSGGNFLYEFPANTFTQGQGHPYYVCVTFTTTSGEVGFGKWKLTAQSIVPPF